MRQFRLSVQPKAKQYCARSGGAYVVTGSYLFGRVPRELNSSFVIHHSSLEFCRSFIEMISKNGDFGKLREVKERSKRGDFGVKTQALLRVKVSCFERQSNLDCSSIELELPKKGALWRVTSVSFLTRKPL